MQYTSKYESPLGRILLAADEDGLTGLWFEKPEDSSLRLEGPEDHARRMGSAGEDRELPAIGQAKRWLDIYFSGREPGFQPPFHFTGTRFQNEVWKMLCEIPYGKTDTYGGIAKRLAEKRGIARMSAQAVGGAVGRNAISILVPCHRVVGSDGNLTGYGGGIGRKAALLKLEHGYQENFFMPKKGTALIAKAYSIKRQLSQ